VNSSRDRSAKFWFTFGDTWQGTGSSSSRACLIYQRGTRPRDRSCEGTDRSRRRREGSAEKQRSYPLVPHLRRVARAVAVLFFPTFHLASPRGSARVREREREREREGGRGGGIASYTLGFERNGFRERRSFCRREVEMINEKSPPEVSRRESGRARTRAGYKRCTETAPSPSLSLSFGDYPRVLPRAVELICFALFRL